MHVIHLRPLVAPQVFPLMEGLLLEIQQEEYLLYQLIQRQVLFLQQLEINIHMQVILLQQPELLPLVLVLIMVQQHHGQLV
jgi:hypothetical protein